MAVHLIEIPYDSGHLDRHMGRGPDRFTIGRFVTVHDVLAAVWA